MTNLEKFLLGTMLVGGLALGVPGCSSKNKDAKEDKKEIKAKNQQNITYGDFKMRMRQITPEVMLCVILTEATEFDNNGLCKPYRKKLNNGQWDKWTIGFGLTELDGKPVNENTRHITIQEAYEKSVKFFEDIETYYFMWCYEIGIDGLHIDTKEKALGLADIMYNSNTSCIENKFDTNHCDRNEELRKLYKEHGDNVTAKQVKAIFAKHPIKGNYSFYKALDGGTVKDWANTLGGFCAEKGGIYWRRWLQGQIATGNVTYKDLLDLPIGSMYEFWCIIGQKKSALFDTNKDGDITVNPDGLEKFKQWVKNPVTKEGIYNPNKTVRQILNSIDSDLVSKIEQGKSISAGYSNTISFDVVQKTYTCNELNDSSYIAYKNGDYDKAVKAGKNALNVAKTEKQKGAANYNIGISYLEKGNYNKAVHYLEQSLAHNETSAGKDALKNAQDKRAKRRNKTTAFLIIGGCAVAAATIYGRKKYIARKQGHR